MGFSDSESCFEITSSHGSSLCLSFSSCLVDIWSALSCVFESVRSAEIVCPRQRDISDSANGFISDFNV